MNKLGCSLEQLVIILEESEYVAPRSPERVPIELFDEGKRSMFRERLEGVSIMGFYVRIGYFNRNGDYGHEGRYYYDFKEYDWYKPITSNLDDVYSTMNVIEKYNIEFIKAYEVKCSEIV